MNMISPKACLFDLDGLLIDSEPLHSEVWGKTTASFGSSLSIKQLDFLRGRRRDECVKQILEWTNLDIEPEKFLFKHKFFYRELLNKTDEIKGAEKLVRWCASNNVPMALVTSSSSESVNFKSEPHKWLNLIKIRVLGDDNELKRGKPAPDPFLLGARRLNVDPKCCWAFEDSNAGISAALAAGCQVWQLISTKEIKKRKEDILKNNIYQINHLETALNELKNKWKTNINKDD